jgi:hypothetical protein
MVRSESSCLVNGGDVNAKRTRATGLRGYKEGRWECVQGESASRVRGLSRHGISRPQRYPTRSIRTESSRPCFESGTLPTAPAPTTRSSERVRFFHGSTAARRQMGKWAR